MTGLLEIRGIDEAQVIKLRRAAQALQLLEGKWTLVILDAMRDRPVRLSELKRAIPTASKKALTSSLRSLEKARIIIRRDLSTTLLHVEYSLSEGMEISLISLVDHIISCGAISEEHLRLFIATASASDDQEKGSRLTFPEGSTGLTRV